MRSPLRLHSPRQMMARVDAAERRLRVCERRMRPRENKRSTAIEVAVWKEESARACEDKYTVLTYPGWSGN